MKDILDWIVTSLCEFEKNVINLFFIHNQILSIIGLQALPSPTAFQGRCLNFFSGTMHKRLQTYSVLHCKMQIHFHGLLTAPSNNKSNAIEIKKTLELCLKHPVLTDSITLNWLLCTYYLVNSTWFPGIKEGCQKILTGLTTLLSSLQ